VGFLRSGGHVEDCPHPLYHRHRFPAEIIAHAVWLYYRFPLSLRMVEDMLAARGMRFWSSRRMAEPPSLSLGYSRSADKIFINNSNSLSVCVRLCPGVSPSFQPPIPALGHSLMHRSYIRQVLSHSQFHELGL
jgi:hypothetical protein